MIYLVTARSVYCNVPVPIVSDSISHHPMRKYVCVCVFISHSGYLLIGHISIVSSGFVYLLASPKLGIVRVGMLNRKALGRKTFVRISSDVSGRHNQISRIQTVPPTVKAKENNSKPGLALLVCRIFIYY